MSFQTQHSRIVERSSSASREVNNSPVLTLHCPRVHFCMFYFPFVFLFRFNYSLSASVCVLYRCTCPSPRVPHTDRKPVYPTTVAHLRFEVCIWGPWYHEDLFSLEPRRSWLHATSCRSNSIDNDDLTDCYSALWSSRLPGLNRALFSTDKTVWGSECDRGQASEIRKLR